MDESMNWFKNSKKSWDSSWYSYTGWWNTGFFCRSFTLTSSVELELTIQASCKGIKTSLPFLGILSSVLAASRYKSEYTFLCTFEESLNEMIPLGEVRIRWVSTKNCKNIAYTKEWCADVVRKTRRYLITTARAGRARLPLRWPWLQIIILQPSLLMAFVTWRGLIFRKSRFCRRKSWIPVVDWEFGKSFTKFAELTNEMQTLMTSLHKEVRLTDPWVPAWRRNSKYESRYETTNQFFIFGRQISSLAWEGFSNIKQRWQEPRRVKGHEQTC